MMVRMSAGRSRLLGGTALLALLLGVVLGWYTNRPDRTGVGTASPPARSGPLRGVYVVRHTLRRPDSIDGAIEQAAAMGANALFVQVNGRAEAYYRSDVVVPAAEVAPDFDPLAYVVDRAHAKGLAVHAWINVYTAGMLVERPAHPDHVLNRHPDWVTVDRSGRSLWDYDWQEAQGLVPARMLDPGVPAVADYVWRSVVEVAERYAVDGIHLDYMRYPSVRFGFHPISVQRFAAEYGFDPLALVQNAPTFVAQQGREAFDRRLQLWDAWRRQQVTQLVDRIAASLRTVRPGLLFSVAVEPDLQTAVAERLQDWPRWLAEGLVDAVVPMAYHPDPQVVDTHVKGVVAQAATRAQPVYAGLGAYMVTDAPDVLRRQMDGAQQAGAAGILLFSYDTLADYPALADTVAEAWGATSATVAR